MHIQLQKRNKRLDKKSKKKKYNQPRRTKQNKPLQKTNIRNNRLKKLQNH